MSYPSIPEEIEPFLKYSRQVATAITKNESMLNLMIPVYGRLVKKYPEMEDSLRKLNFDDITRALEPYRNHPKYGIPVQVVIDGGREWVEQHLKGLREKFLV